MQKIKKNKIVVSTLIILILLCGVLYIYKITKKETPSGLSVLSLQFTSQENGSVALFMEKLKSEGKIDFKEQTYSGMGKFINEINGIKNSGEKNWIYYVNGEKANIGVSNYQINQGDIVSWKYEKGY